MTAGVLAGNFYVEGAFDECLDLQGKAKYCTAPLSVGLPLPLTTSFCIPNYCTAEDLSFLINMPRVLSIEASQITCLSTKKPPYHWTAILMIVICFIIGSLVAVSTTVDLLLRLWKENKIQLFIGLIPDGVINENSTSDKRPLQPKPAATATKAIRNATQSNGFKPFLFIKQSPLSSPPNRHL